MSDLWADEQHTPEEVLGHYDLHTSEGTVNISNDPAAILDLWHALAGSIADADALLAVVRALEKQNELHPIEEVKEAIDALPEHLKGE
jgi:hypothetical protein